MKRFLFTLLISLLSSANLKAQTSTVGGVPVVIRNVVTDDCGGGTRFTNNTIASGATITFSTTGQEIITSATAGGNGKSRIVMTASYSPFDGNITFTAIIQAEVEGTNYHCFVGVGSPNAAAADITMTGNNIGFEFDRSAGTTTVYASCANGTTQTKTSMTGFTSATDIVYTFVKKGTASVDFYVNGTYKCTITTNIPSGTNTGFFGQSISNRNTASSTIFNVGNYYWEKTFNSTK